MKIIQVGTGFFSVPPEGAGAAETAIHSLAKQLSYLGNDVCVVDFTRRGKENVPYRFEVVPSRFDPRKKLGHILRGVHFGVKSSFLLSKLLENEHCDIVHFHNQFTGLWGIGVAKRHSKPSVYTLHNPVWGLGTESSSLQNKVRFGQEILCLKRASKVISVSRILSENVVKYLSIDRNKIDVIPNGIDVNIFRPDVEHAELREKIAPNGETVFLNVARVAKYKNQLLLLKAIALVVKERSDVKFLFVGPIDDERYFYEIQRTISKNNLQKYVRFYGFVSFENLLKLYSLADVFVLPSVTEGLPLVLLEAMACRQAVVASNIDSIRELVQGVGILVNPYSIEELASSLISLADDRRKREEMGRRARETVVRNFTWEIIAEKMQRMYEKLV